MIYFSIISVWLKPASVFPSLLLFAAKLLWVTPKDPGVCGSLPCYQPCAVPLFSKDNSSPPGKCLHRQHEGVTVIQLLLGTSWVWRQLTAPCTAFPTGKGDINTFKRNPHKDHTVFRRNCTFRSFLLPSGLVTTWKAGLGNPKSPRAKSHVDLVYMQHKLFPGLFLGGIRPSALVLAGQEWFYLGGTAATFQGNCLSIWIPSEEWNQTWALIIPMFNSKATAPGTLRWRHDIGLLWHFQLLGQALCRQSSKDSRVTPPENMPIVWPRA